jgi:hypothetical protein
MAGNPNLPPTPEDARLAIAGQAVASAFLCTRCGNLCSERYYSLNTLLLCARCAMSAKRDIEQSDSWGQLFRSAAFGFGGAIVGAVIFYGVMALTNLIIGFTALLTGYVVGWSVRKGARNFMRRRHQWLALVLTYYSIGMSVVPLTIQMAKQREFAAAATREAALVDASPDSAATTDSASTQAPAAPSRRVRKSGLPLPLEFVRLMLSIFILPLLFVVSSMPGGIISALIIALGMRQAWRMTAGRSLALAGPYRIGA